MTTKRIPITRGNVPLRRWWSRVGSDSVKVVCQAAGIGFSSFKHVAAGRRAMSPATAAAFIAGGARVKLADLIYRPAPPPEPTPAPRTRRRK